MRTSFLLVQLALTSTGSALATNTPGLQNLGNTCYLNAQLQSAFHIPRVRQLVQASASEGSSSVLVPQDTAYVDDNELCSPALLALARLFHDMDTSSSAVDPRQFCQALGIPVFQQQDSQEFWKLLLPTLQLRPLTKLYSGKLESYIRALDGSGRHRNRPEPFLDLSLDLQPATSSSVESSVRTLFGEPELLSAAEGNGWRPDKDSEPVDAHKGSRLTEDLPSILQLHLKRFQFDWQTETMSKLNDPVSFPLSLDLPVEAPAEGPLDASKCRYVLQAVVIHSGQYGSGHYYSYVRPDVRKEETWLRFNDHDVEKVTWQDVTADAYGGLQDAPMSSTKNFFSRLAAIFKRKHSQTKSHGYGGESSSAYVLQYVRQCDIPELYGGEPSQ